MRTKSVFIFGLMTLLVVGGGVFFEQNPSVSQVTPEFKCAYTYEIDAREKIPTTVYWIPEQQKNVPVIYWKSQSFKDWSPDARCETVSPKLNRALKERRLNYLAIGEVNNSDVICSISAEADPCTSDNQLFTIKQNQNSNDVLIGLSGALEGESGPLYQSGGKTYIEIKLKKLKEQPGIKIDE